MLQKEVETERLVLREPQKLDLAPLHQILAEPTVGIWLGKPQGFLLRETKDLLDRFLTYWEEDGYGPWAAWDKKTGLLIGYCGLRYTTALKETELLYGLHSHYWGKGFITEASRTALELGRDALQLSKIISYTLPNNQASRRVMEKLNMVYVRDFVHADLLHVFYRTQW
ncbi:MAG: GNAT family N-acetyltransferase [Bacteroidota bacterium]